MNTQTPHQKIKIIDRVCLKIYNERDKLKIKIRVLTDIYNRHLAIRLFSNKKFKKKKPTNMKEYERWNFIKYRNK